MNYLFVSSSSETLASTGMVVTGNASYANSATSWRPPNPHCQRPIYWVIKLREIGLFIGVSTDVRCPSDIVHGVEGSEQNADGAYQRKIVLQGPFLPSVVTHSRQVHFLTPDLTHFQGGKPEEGEMALRALPGSYNA